MRSRIFVCLPALALWLIACGGLSVIASPTAVITIPTTWTPSPIPSPTQTATATVYPTDTSTVPPSETLLPITTSPPQLTLEPQRVMQGPGELIIPILLYHHIGFSSKGESVYYVSPEGFDQQMNLLYQWGYQTISVELLARAVAEEPSCLPNRSS